MMSKEVGGLFILPRSDVISWMVDLCGRVAITGHASEALHRSIQAAKCVLITRSPVAITMTRRTPEERHLLQDLHDRDSTAVCRFIYTLVMEPSKRVDVKQEIYEFIMLLSFKELQHLKYLKSIIGKAKGYKYVS